ncbi:MAG: acyclic terpene utilization AtuA family protein [Bryobacteraceae bacterium]
MIRIANAQGFWGDSLEAPLDQLRGGPIDYLTLDYLAEVTMSILQKQFSRDPQLGYARDFVQMMERGAKEIVERRVKVVANAGGVNPQTCARAVEAALARAGYAGRLKVAVVTGDNILGRLDEFTAKGVELRNIDTGAPLSMIRERVRSANAYLGAFPIAEALGKGADIVITGRCSDVALSLGSTIYEFGWKPTDWDLLAAGTVGGHVIECGAQATGGNCQVDWERIPDLANIGYPILEAEPDGRFAVTKHPNTGGRVSVAGVTEQLVYEIGDPHSYITPDVIADFTTIQLQQAGPDRVTFSNIRGRAATDFYKASISYSAGYKAVGTMTYGWPDAVKKARAADQILRTRLARLGLRFDAIHTEFVGANACHGDLLSGEPSPDLAEVTLRIGVRHSDAAAVERFTRELAPLALNGPPVVTYPSGGKPKVEEVIAYWPALVPKSEIAATVTLLDPKKKGDA